MTRLQFHVVAGFAMTVNKAQGLTIKEGVVIHWVGGKRFRPAAKHGLPFVAWTRSESFAMTAFKNLPPWNDFMKGKDAERYSDSMLAMRKTSTAHLERLHRQTLAEHSNLTTPEEEDRVWERWCQQLAGRAKRQRREGERMPCPACASGELKDGGGRGGTEYLA